jgi:hypothetical protein
MSSDHESTFDPPRCQALNQNGAPCSAQHYRDGWCWWHHPELKDKLRAVSAKGGRNRSNEARAKKALAGDLRDMAGVKASLLSALAKVERGGLDPAQASAMATLARAIVAVSGVADFEGQLAEMRQEIAELAGRRDAS